MGYLLILTLGLFLSGCENAPQPRPPLPQPSEEEQRVAFEAVRGCLKQKARVLDDNLSDARTIAEALVSACARQYQAAAELHGRGLSPNAKRLYLEQVPSTYIEPALRAVLDYRRSKREQP